jgi:transposase
MAGNTSAKKTLKSFLEKIEKQYGKAQRIWLMDRGIPTEATLKEMQESDPPVLYLVGTPRGRLSKLESQLAKVNWQKAREAVEVKLLPQDKEVYVLARSLERRKTDRSIRRRQLKKLWKRLGELKQMKLKRDTLLMRLGAARQAAPAAWRLVKIQLPKKNRKLGFSLCKDKLREVRRREGQYLLRSNLTGQGPAQLWEFYLWLVRIEEAFKHLKGDLAIRPIFHQKLERIEAHIFVAFLAYCVQASLGWRLKNLAPGLSVRSVLEKMAQMQMIDVHLPTTDGREVILSRYTQPEADQKLLLEQLKLTLPSQPPPKITAPKAKKK